ncbi:MAG: hypothetical protein MUD10_04820 [Candidatus Pacebacteria bacterium]|jgi:hypothetical protein|nr:hypothetical protein [Candidatus Paceibacterota bacterium]
MKYIFANWKCNPEGAVEAKKLLAEYAKLLIMQIRGGLTSTNLLSSVKVGAGIDIKKIYVIISNT